MELQKTRDQQPNPEQLHVVRAVSVLARIGTPEANKALPSLAENAFLLLPMDGDERRRTSHELLGAFCGAVRNLEANGRPEARQLL